METKMKTYDLIFTRHLPDREIGEEDFCITAQGKKGEKWLWANTSADDTYPPEADAWISDIAEYRQLMNKARSDGMSLTEEAD